MLKVCTVTGSVLTVPLQTCRVQEFRRNFLVNMGKRKRQQRQLQNFRQPNASAHVVAKRLHGDDILRKDQPVMNTTLLDSTLPSSDSKTSDATVANLVKHVIVRCFCSFFAKEVFCFRS